MALNYGNVEFWETPPVTADAVTSVENGVTKDNDGVLEPL